MPRRDTVTAAAQANLEGQPWLAGPTIDWDYLVRIRPSLLAAGLKPYLLAPEIQRILDSIAHPHHWLLFSTLWYTGAQISEILALRINQFWLDTKKQIVYVTFTTPARQVPVQNATYLRKLANYLSSDTSDDTDRLFPISRQAAQKRLDTIVRKVEEEGVILPFKPSLITFRHSYAVNLVVHGIPLPAIQAWLGHKHLESTVSYAHALTVNADTLLSLTHYAG